MLREDLAAFDRDYNGDASVARLILFVSVSFNLISLIVGLVSPTLAGVASVVAGLVTIVQCFSLTYIYSDFVKWLHEKRSPATRRGYETLGAAVWMIVCVVALVTLRSVPDAPGWAPASIQAFFVLLSSALVLLSAFWRMLERWWDRVRGND